jgi:hypothetical protein
MSDYDTDKFGLVGNDQGKSAQEHFDLVDAILSLPGILTIATVAALIVLATAAGFLK